MPVLTVSAVKGAGIIEDGQVLIAIFGSSPVGIARITGPTSPRADPIGNAVSGQRVVIPAHHPSFPCPTQVEEPASSIFPQATESPLPFRDLALVHAYSASDSGFIPWRIGGKTKIKPGGSMGLLYPRPDLVKSRADAVQAYRQSLGDEP